MTGTCNADVRSAVVNNRSGGAHAAEVDVLEACGVNRAGCPVDGYAVEVTCLGGEVNLVGCFVIRNAGTDVAVDVLDGAYDFAVFRIEYEEFCGIAGVAAVAVIGSDYDELIGGVCTCPVEAALCSVDPKCVFLFGGVGGIFVGSVDASKVRIAGFAVPEACVDVAVLVGDLSVRLTAKFVLINPEGFKGVCAERLNTTAGKSYENHAVRISGRNDGEAGGTDHFAGCNRFTGFFVDLDDIAACVSVDIAADNNRGADCAAAHAVTGLFSPDKLGFYGAGRGLGAGNCHVLVVAAEGRPICTEVGILDAGNILEVNDILAVGELVYAGDSACFGDIALCSGGVGVAFASGEGVFAFFVRSKLVVILVEYADNRVFNVGFKLNFVSTDLVKLEGIDLCVRAVVDCLNGDFELIHFRGNIYIALVNRVFKTVKLSERHRSVRMSDLDHVALFPEAGLVA